ncbi:MAG: tetratricopeptide repeat protein [Planctomycetota bacterium]
MIRIVWTMLLVLATAAGAAAGQQESVVDQYRHVLTLVEKDPAHPYAVLGLVPPTNRENAAEREALDRVVESLAAPAKKQPEDASVRLNYHRALWRRCLYYGSADDGKKALAQLDALIGMTDPGTEENARAFYERAVAVRTLRDALTRGLLSETTAGKVVGGDLGKTTIRYFIDAKRAAMSQGLYGRRSALALGQLYYAVQNDADAAEKALREALELDPDRGYVTNHAYDLLGRLRLAGGKIGRAVTMLEAAGNVSLDADLRTAGFAAELAIHLIKLNRTQDAIGYLRKVHKLATQDGGRASPDIAYALALGYTKLDEPGPALLFWQKYLDANQTGPGARERRAEAQKEAARLAAEGID